MLIIGAARGIGEGIARVFFKAGSNVVVSDIHVSLGEALVNELNLSSNSESSNSPSPKGATVSLSSLYYILHIALLDLKSE